jgi:hypothetical protein
VAAVDTGDGTQDPHRFRDFSRAGIHAPGAQSHRDAACYQRFDRFCVARMHIPIGAKQRPVNISDEDAGCQFAVLAGAAPTGYTETRFLVRDSCS